MTLPPAWILGCYGIGFIALFGAWKIAIGPRLSRRTLATPGQSL